MPPERANDSNWPVELRDTRVGVCTGRRRLKAISKCYLSATDMATGGMGSSLSGPPTRAASNTSSIAVSRWQVASAWSWGEPLWRDLGRGPDNRLVPVRNEADPFRLTIRSPPSGWSCCEASTLVRRHRATSSLRGRCLHAPPPSVRLLPLAAEPERGDGNFSYRPAKLLECLSPHAGMPASLNW